MKKLLKFWLTCAVIVLCSYSAAAETPDRMDNWYSVCSGSDITLPVDVETAADYWVLGPDIAIVHDEILDRYVWEHSGGRHGWIRSRKPLPHSFELRAQVRIMEHNHSVTLAAGVEGYEDNPRRAEKPYEMTARPRDKRTFQVITRRAEQEYYREADGLVAEGPAQWVSTDSILPFHQRRQRRVSGGDNFGERYTSAPSPLEDEDIRREMEAAMDARPKTTDQWMEMRIEYRPSGVQMWANGVLMGEQRPAGPCSGDALLQLNRSVRIASVEINCLANTRDSQYHPVALTDRLNAFISDVEKDDSAALSGLSLPPANSRSLVEDIPFYFSFDPQRGDHVDVGPSLFRARNRTGHYHGRTTWPAYPQNFDPARIMFRVPNRAYSRIWVIAAYDENPSATPVLTARFFRPGATFTIDASREIPGLRADAHFDDAVPLQVTLEDTPEANLWLVPIELDAARIASEMREMPMLSLELTKEVHPYQGYPDPANYGWYQGGLPSGVRVFAMTLEEAPVHMIATGNRHGNAYVSPEHPLWQIDLNNQLTDSVSGRVNLTVTDPYGEKTEELESRFSLPGAGHARLEVPLTPELNGLHTVLTSVELDVYADEVGEIARKGTFVQLPPDRRQATLENSQWGFWHWAGAHGTHDVPEDNFYLLRAAGVRYGRGGDHELRSRWGIRTRPQHIGSRAPSEWAFEYPYDPDIYAEYRDRIGKQAAERFENDPSIPSFSMFIETNISVPLTYGVGAYHHWLGKDDYELSKDEQRRLQAFMTYGKAVAEGIREHAPDARVALGWAEPLLTVPLLAEEFPRELFDYIGVDTPTFERTPEMPVREVTPNRMWLLHEAMKDYGYEDVPIIHTESYYPSSHALALGWQRSADHFVRLSVLSLAMMPNSKLANCFTLHDCSNYWGAQHYGCSGIVGRWPEYNPKPAFPAFATMTRLLDPGQYQGYVPTGSHSVYCLHFISNDRNVYPMWTLRGEREAQISLPEGVESVMVDAAGNEYPLSKADGRDTVILTPEPLWIVSDAEITKVTLGEPEHPKRRREHPLMDHSFAYPVRNRPEDAVAPNEHYVVLDTLETPWNYMDGPYFAHDEGHWGISRFKGPMRSEAVHSEHWDADVWEVALEKPDIRRELAAWYGVFEPEEPLEIPGKARALGIWANGHSNWGRIVYEIEDAGGEVWRSIGTKDGWNCDDIHTWSFFNFDGWRFLEFPLPGHLPYDNYREEQTTWWGSDGGNGVVELPIRLKRIIIEHRTHNIYANELVKVDDPSVQLRGLKAIYDESESMTDAPVVQQREAAGLLQKRWAAEAAPLSNPIAELREHGIGEPTVFLSHQPPDDYDGLVTRLEIELQPVENAEKYHIYVSAYEDGRGAERVESSEEPILEVRRLQPGFPLYLFATYEDSQGEESKPSEALRILLKDDFPFR